MPSVLYTASTFSHIVSFHLPYLRRFRELGWQVSVACGGEMRDIPYADAVYELPLAKSMTDPGNAVAYCSLRYACTSSGRVIVPRLASFQPLRRWARAATPWRKPSEPSSYSMAMRKLFSHVSGLEGV